MEVSNQIQARSLPPGRFTDVKEPRYPLNKGLRGGLRAGLGDLDSNPGPCDTVNECIWDGSQKKYGLFPQKVGY